MRNGNGHALQSELPAQADSPAWSLLRRHRWRLHGNGVVENRKQQSPRNGEQTNRTKHQQRAEAEEIGHPAGVIDAGADLTCTGAVVLVVDDLAAVPAAD